MIKKVILPLVIALFLMILPSLYAAPTVKVYSPPTAFSACIFGLISARRRWSRG